MARSFKNIKVYAGDNFYRPAQAKIKNLVVIPSKSQANGNDVGKEDVMLKCKVCMIRNVHTMRKT